jgi:hypothetical protein
MDQRFSILSAIGITLAVLLALAIYSSLDLLLEPNAVAAHARPPKGGHPSSEPLSGLWLPIPPLWR